MPVALDIMVTNDSCHWAATLGLGPLSTMISFAWTLTNT